ncbi:MAG: hypothetical protein J1F35_01995 [Erysipelotrichales bacterium]|nr:hypothetical protein [Erysipelotrichales bacterium]
MKKDFNILNYFNTRALFMGVGLSRVLSTCHEHIIITVFIGMLIGLFFLYLFRLEMKSSIINIFLNCVIIIIALVILINMISTMYLTEMPKFMIGVPFILLSLYLLSKKEIVLYRIGGILLAINLICYFLSFLSLLKYVNLNNFHYTNTGINKVLLAAFQYAIFSVTPTFFMRNKDTKDISIYKMYIISSITMCVIFLFTYGILGSTLTGIVRYPEYLILKEVMISEAVQNIENIVSFMWIIDAFMIISNCGNSIKHNLNNKNYIYIIFPVLLFITSYMNNHYEYLLMVYHYTHFVLAGSLILLWLANRKLIFVKR